MRKPPFPPDKVDEYRNLCTRLDLLRKKEQELLLQYTDQSVPIKDLRAQIAGNETLKKKLESEEPDADALAAALAQTDQPGISLSDNAAQIALLETRINILNSQLNQIQSEAAKIDESKATIAELERREQRQEAELEYFQRNLEQARIDEHDRRREGSRASAHPITVTAGQKMVQETQKNGGHLCRQAALAPDWRWHF